VFALIDGFVPEAAWLTDGETLTYLHSCISTNRLVHRAITDTTDVTSRVAAVGTLNL
jgi:hypothetical protein